VTGVTEPADDRIALVAGLHDGARLPRTGLFDLLADDVEWWVAGPADAFPWAGTFHGRDGVRQWADALNAAMDYTRFELLEILGVGDHVVEVIGAGGTARATDRPFESEVGSGRSAAGPRCVSGASATRTRTPRRSLATSRHSPVTRPTLVANGKR
jgi:ketosteroid isomerase-like protein